MNKTLLANLIACLCICFTSVLNAQDVNVTGTVSDVASGENVIGATILVKGTTIGTFSDIDGNFSLKVNSLNDTLVVSYIGYETTTIPLAGRENLLVELIEATSQLDEVVVVGYGRQKKKVVTGSIASVSAEDIESQPILRVEQALQGRTAGVQVTNQSGQPGDEPTVRVRGIGTTGFAKPLYIVDGMPVGGIDYLNPGDIESIDVLKDAASAAIYGARGANGVILITTKSGKRNSKFNISYNGYHGVQNVARTLDMLNAEEYRELMNEGARNAGLSEPFDLNEIPANDTDWQDALFVKDAPMQSHQISVSGGGDKSSFASSLSYFTQEGIIGGPKSKFDRYTGRINNVNKVNDWVNVGVNLAYTHLIKRGIATNSSFNGAYGSALNLDPLTPVFETDPTILAEYPYSIEPVVSDQAGNIYGISNNVGAEVVNPLALLEIANAETRKDELVGNVYAEIKPHKDVTVRTSLGTNLAYLINDSFRPLFFLNGAQLNDNKTSVTKNIQRYFTWQWENTILYEKEIGDHSFSGLLGTTANEFAFEDLTGFNADVPVDDPNNVYLNLATDTVWTANGGATHSALFSVFGRANYAFKDKYSVTAIVRRDGSSKFGANSRYGIFPSLGFAWVASEEEFLQNLGAVDYLKLRASWGVNGNQEIGDYQFVSIINKGRGYTFATGRDVGSSPLFIENNDIRWEESEQLNFGVDLGFFDGKLQGSLDYYVKTTSGLLERIPIPGHVGNDGPISNVGSIQNRGIEMVLNWREKKGDLSYFFGMNAGYNKNEVTEIGNAQKVINGASWAIAGAVTRSEEGLPIAYFWGFETDGIFQNQSEVFQHINQDGNLLQANAKPGDVRFVDSNGDGIINEDDRTYLGNPTPDVTFGFNASVSYKQIDMSFFLQGAIGNEIFNGTQRQDLRFTNRTAAIKDRWTGEGTSNSTPRYTWIDANNNYRVSDLYVEDGSFMRLKNIQIGYTLPENFLSKIGAENWRFYISGENLLTFTKYTGVDPEIGAFGSFDIGIDRAIYPPARTVRFGTSITF